MSLLVAALLIAGLRVWRRRQRSSRATTVELVPGQIETFNLPEAAN